MACQPTMSGQDDYLSGQTFGLLVILTKHFNKRPGKKKTFSLTPHYVSRGQPSFIYFIFLSVTLVRSSYYCEYLHFDWSEERHD